jgi:hypothetical protein
MTYNAALRAIGLGYSNVLWYRGGVEPGSTHGGPFNPWKASADSKARDRLRQQRHAEPPSHAPQRPGSLR